MEGELEMSTDDPRDDVPEADRVEQQQDVVPDAETDDGGDDIEIDPLQGNEADLLEQRRSVPAQDDDYDR
jgi:hypothetical protein